MQSATKVKICIPSLLEICLISIGLLRIEVMTRFARAKGSKADNERRPMEATAWSEVKRQG